MEIVISQDKTKIAYEKQGEGAPLIIIGGALADHAFYTPLASELAKYFTVYNFDRRGRGESGDILPYSVEREVEDVTAIIAQAGEPVSIYGHSAGSALALHVAASGAPVKEMILADPPYTAHGGDDANAAENFRQESAKVQALHDEGKHKENVMNFLGGMGLPSEMIEASLNSPAGEGMIAGAKALPYDYAVLGDGLVPTETARAVKAKTVVWASEYALDAAKQLAEAIPDATLQTLTTSTHEMAPAEIASKIREALGN